MKIAICLPSYNEAKNIQNSTKIVDSGLTKYFPNQECYIVNADNTSPDGTNELFNKVQTNAKKISILETNPGKGYNLINFFEFCQKNQIDFAATIDSDVVSINQEWIQKLISPLIRGEADYLTPIYKRHRYEGSTTNHFVFPGVFAVCNQFIRQPIAGDFAFNKKFVDMILAQEINEEIKHYGIDIFMTLNACFNNLKVGQVLLGNKFHSPSFNKMEGMFKQVLRAYIFTLQKNIDKIKNHKNILNNIPVFEESISTVKTFKHKQFAIDKYAESKQFLAEKGIKISKSNIGKIWVKYFAQFINHIKNNTLDCEFIEIFEHLFFARATAFWLHAEYISAKSAEDEIIQQSKNIFKEVNV